MEQKPFYLKDTFDFVVDMFEMKASTLGLKISHSYCTELESFSNWEDEVHPIH